MGPGPLAFRLLPVPGQGGKILGDHRIYLAGERMVNPEEDEAWEAVSGSRSWAGPGLSWGEIGGALGRYRETPAGVSAWRLMGGLFGTAPCPSAT